MTKNSRSRKKENILKGVFILLLFSLWIFFAVCFWNGTYPLFRLADCPYITYLEKYLDAQYFNAVRTYLHIAPFVFATYYFTVTLPEALKKHLKSAKVKTVYTVISGIFILAGFLLTAGCCTEIPSVLKQYLSPQLMDSLVRISDAVYLRLTPVFLILIPVTVLIAKLADREKKPVSFRVSLMSYIFCILTGMIIAAVSCLMLAMVQPYMPDAVSAVQEFCRILASSSSMCLIALVLAPLIEETAFRGLIQHHLQTYFRPWAAILPASAAFGIWHRNPGQFVYTFYFGLIAGAFYIASGKLRHTVLIHFTMNLCAVLAFSSEKTVIPVRIEQIRNIYYYLIGRSPLQAFLLVSVLTLAAAAMIRIIQRCSEN